MEIKKLKLLLPTKRSLWFLCSSLNPSLAPSYKTYTKVIRSKNKPLFNVYGWPSKIKEHRLKTKKYICFYLLTHYLLWFWKTKHYLQNYLYLDLNSVSQTRSKKIILVVNKWIETEKCVLSVLRIIAARFIYVKLECLFFGHCQNSAEIKV